MFLYADHFSNPESYDTWLSLRWPSNPAAGTGTLKEAEQSLAVA